MTLFEEFKNWYRDTHGNDLQLGAVRYALLALSGQPAIYSGGHARSKARAAALVEEFLVSRKLGTPKEDAVKLIKSGFTVSNGARLLIRLYPELAYSKALELMNEATQKIAA